MQNGIDRRAAALLLAAVVFAAGCAGHAARMQRLADEAEIRRLHIAYAWAVDAKDIEGLMALFSENVVYDLSAYGFEPAVGKEAVRKTFLEGIFEYVECSFIGISNIRIEIEGDRARGADYFVHAGYNPRDRPPDTRSYTEGQHFFEFEREDGHWRISALRGSPFYERWEPFDPQGLRRCPRE